MVGEIVEAEPIDMSCQIILYSLEPVTAAYPLDCHPAANSFSVSSRKGFRTKPPPTLYTAAANLASPISFLICSKAEATDAESVTSVSMPIACPPFALISDTMGS